MAGGPNDPARGRPSPALKTIHATELGVQLLPKPIDLGGGIQFLGYGPPPGKLRFVADDNSRAADTTNVDQIWTGGITGLNLTGAGLVAGVWDSGRVLSSHQELIGRVTLVDAGGTSDHSTHVAGTIGATGVNANSRGMASSISIRSRNSSNDLNELNTDANSINVSNHSYGPFAGWDDRINWGFGNVSTWYADRALYSVEDPQFGKYNGDARFMDQILNNKPHLVSCWSAGNHRGEGFSNLAGDNTYVSFFSTAPIGGTDLGGGWYRVPNSGATVGPPDDGNGGTGYDTISGDKCSKNAVIVGSVNDITADPIVTVNISSFSSFGPIDDGRIKPDVCGNGAGLTSCIDTSTTSYASFSGTSMSSPNVCGVSALLIEHYKNLNAAALPRSATVKGLLTHNAFDAGNVGPDYRFGWGLVDAAKAAAFLTESESASPLVNHLYQATYSGTTQDYGFTYSGSGAIKATLVWTDQAPVASVASGLDLDTKVLIRDLDLTIIGPGPTTHWPWTLDKDNPTVAAVRTTRNDVDNVEQVVIDAPVAGSYTVRISHTTGSFTQDYSLLVSNLSIGVPPVVDPIADDSTACGSAYSSSAPTLSQGTAPITWTLEVGPPLMTIDAGTGVVSWTNPTTSVSPHTVTVKATNAQGSDMRTWNLTVAPGDFDGDGLLTELDVPELVDHLLGVSATRPCAADVNLDTLLDGLDAQSFADGI